MKTIVKYITKSMEQKTSVINGEISIQEAAVLFFNLTEEVIILSVEVQS